MKERELWLSPGLLTRYQRAVDARDEGSRDEPANHRQRVEHEPKNQAQQHFREVVFGARYPAWAKGYTIVSIFDDVADVPGLPMFHGVIVTRASASEPSALVVT